MSLKWKINRLRAMSAAEIAHRATQAVHSRVQQWGGARARPARPQGVPGKPWIEPLPRQFDPARYRAAAERILAGSYRVFALDDAELGFPPRWNRDPRTGTAAPLVFGKTLDYRDERLVGDIKYLWEPNRHLELVTLAQAWHLTRERQYADGCRRLLDSWFEQCPYLLGPNWSSSLELALRLVNWSFAWHLLGGERSELFEPPDGEAFRRRWLDSIYQHCHFIAQHRSLHSSANNHLLGEWLGLLAGASTWPLWDESAGWGARAQRGFETESLKQNAPDGVNREQAIWYHHEVADMMLIAGRILKAQGRDFSAGYWQRWDGMLGFIESVMDVAGNVPAFGDSDDAVMVRFDPGSDFNVYRSLLATGAVLRGRGDFARKAGTFDDKSRWLLGDVGELAFAQLEPLRPQSVQQSFPDGGYYILGSDFDTRREVRIVADAGPLGYLSLAAHGHADALSFTASAGGAELLIDPGTFAYHTNRTWRDYFRGTSAHNTVRIDGRDQSDPGGNFLWLRHANATCLAFETGAHEDRLLAEHDGYLALPEPVRHRRELRYAKEARVLTVTDTLSGRGDHDVELFWHFAEQCVLEQHADHVVASQGSRRLRLTFPQGCLARLFCGEESIPAGWISRSFDSKIAAMTLRLSCRMSREWQGITQLRFEPGVG